MVQSIDKDRDQLKRVSVRGWQRSKQHFGHTRRWRPFTRWKRKETFASAFERRVAGATANVDTPYEFGDRFKIVERRFLTVHKEADLSVRPSKGETRATAFQELRLET